MTDESPQPEPMPSPLPGWSVAVAKALRVERRERKALHRQNLEQRERIKELEKINRQLQRQVYLKDE